MSDETVCYCMDISREEIVDAIKNKGAKTVEAITEITEAGSGCGGCVSAIEEILEEETSK
jgi:bacterioferritin-associated ferredoxin